MSDLVWSFADVPASSSDPSLPPERGQHRGPGGGEAEAADGDRLSQVFFLSLHDEFCLYSHTRPRFDIC